MEIYVVEGATLSCLNGTAVSQLLVPDDHGVYLSGKKQANQKDFVAYKNILSFGLCKGNGLQPCAPVTLPWQLVKSNVLLDNSPTLLHTSICICVAHTGVIKVEKDGQ